MRTISAALALSFLASAAFAQQVPAIQNGGKQQYGSPGHARQTAPQQDTTEKVEFPPKLDAGIPVEPLSKRQRKAIGIAKKRINDKLMPAQGEDGSVVYTYGHTIPDLICSPGNWCTIQLEKGEIVVGPDGRPDANVFITDKANWWFYLSARGDRRAMYTDILVSPKYPGTKASISWGTNKGRRYTVNLRSTDKQWMPLMTFAYPDDQVMMANAAYTRAVGGGGDKPTLAMEVGGGAGVNIASLDSAFEIDGDASFRPVAVYTDGSRTVVDFGRVIEDMPVLVGIGNDGGLFSSPSRYTMNVNVIAGGSKLLVDGVFDKAALVAGLGSDQREVLIKRRGR